MASNHIIKFFFFENGKFDLPGSSIKTSSKSGLTTGQLAYISISLTLSCTLYTVIIYRVLSPLQSRVHQASNMAGNVLLSP